MPRPTTGERRTRPKKPFGEAADPRNGQRVAMQVPTTRLVEPFDPPEGIEHEWSLMAWEEFWNDRASYLLTNSTKDILIRWIDALQRYYWANEEADKDPVQTGSTGQPVLNHYYKIAERAISVVQNCEAQLGIGGLNASKFGLAVLQERKGLQEINHTFIEAETENDNRPETDPRADPD